MGGCTGRKRVNASLLHVATSCFLAAQQPGATFGRVLTLSLSARKQHFPFSTWPPRPQPHGRRPANARSRAPANAKAMFTGSSIWIVPAGAVGETEALADAAVAAPGVRETGVADLFEAAACKRTPAVGADDRFSRFHVCQSFAFWWRSLVMCPFSSVTSLLQRLHSQVS